MKQKRRKPDILSLIFPRCCPVCHEVVEDPGERACRICRTKLTYIREPFCRKCGKPLESVRQEYCGDCRGKRHFFLQGRAPFVYDETMRGSIAMYKYGGRKEYAAFYAEEILRVCAEEMRLWRAEALVPIPLHPSRRRKRGFNQAGLLARELSRRTGIPAEEHLLKRVKKTHVQKELNDQERRKNLKGAFALREEKLPYKRIILVDDIYTTGSTIDEAAGVLRENGAESVYFLSICVGRGC